jgi:hypothetical protein
MTYFMNEFAYEKLKNFQRVKSLKELYHSQFKKNLYEDETIISIKENINNYKKKEQIRLKKIDFLTKLLEKIEEKTTNNKIIKVNR